MADLIAKNTEADRNKGGSPIPCKQLQCITGGIYLRFRHGSINFF